MKDEKIKRDDKCGILNLHLSDAVQRSLTVNVLTF